MLFASLYIQLSWYASKIHPLVKCSELEQPFSHYIQFCFFLIRTEYQHLKKNKAPLKNFYIIHIFFNVKIIILYIDLGFTMFCLQLSLYQLTNAIKKLFLNIFSEEKTDINIVKEWLFNFRVHSSHLLSQALLSSEFYLHTLKVGYIKKETAYCRTYIMNYFYVDKKERIFYQLVTISYITLIVSPPSHSQVLGWSSQKLKRLKNHPILV